MNGVQDVMEEEIKRFPRTNEINVDSATQLHSVSGDKSSEESVGKFNKDFQDEPSELDEFKPGEIRDHIGRLIDKAQLLALQKLEKILSDVNSVVAVEDAIDIIMKLADLKLTQSWTKKLEKAILKNPANLGGGKAGSMMNKLQAFATRTKRAASTDQREAANKLANQSEDLPSDD